MAGFIFYWLPPIMLMAGLLFGLMLLILGLKGVSKARKLRFSGATTSAYVTEKTVRVTKHRGRRSSGPDRHTSRTHYLSYSFQIDGKDFDDTAIAPSDLWRTVDEGSEVEIVYYTKDPSVSQLKASVLGASGLDGGIQIGAGLVFSIGTLFILVTNTLNAYHGPDPLVHDTNWTERNGVVRWVRVPEDPYLRVFAPDARRIYVEIGEMEPGKLYSERETLIYPYQTKGIVLKPGTELRAFINPENEFFSILEIESTPR
ncbi:MAG: hypothetical protein P8Q48_09530 [Paracoccaceae bacterium]|nr:hypothetical protein [Paracoccaceae bacterium]